MHAAAFTRGYGLDLTCMQLHEPGRWWLGATVLSNHLQHVLMHVPDARLAAVTDSMELTCRSIHPSIDLTWHAKFVRARSSGDGDGTACACRSLEARSYILYTANSSLL